MSRSVSVASGATHVAYASLEPIADEESGAVREFDSDDFNFAVEDFQGYLPQLCPSLSPCDSWLGSGRSEDHALLENQHCFVGVSEYNGLVSVWVVPKEEDSHGYNLSKHWCEQVGDKLVNAGAGCFGNKLRSVGRFSNGEQIFQPVDGVQRGDLGIGFTSKEGWL
jgi:hypothetical protein